MAWLDKFSKSLNPEGCIEEVDNSSVGNVSAEDNDKSTTIEWQEKRPDPPANYLVSTIARNMKEIENLNVETSNGCCSYREKYLSLLKNYDEAQDTMGQLRRNLSIVTEQLITRDELFSSHMARIREAFSHLDEELELKDDNKSFWLSLEPRGALRRKPVSEIASLS